MNVKRWFDPGFSIFARCCAMILLVALVLPQPVTAMDDSPRATAAASPTGELHGAVTRADQAGLATSLAGIPLKLIDLPDKTAARSTIADENGRYRFGDLSAGSYSLEADLQGFKPYAVKIEIKDSESRSQDILLELAAVSSSVEVQAEAASVTEHTIKPATTLTEREIPALPMEQQLYTEAIRFSPGVVRAMDGKLNIKGQAENQGMLLVDSARMVDPVTGGFSVGVPLAAVETLNVYETPYNAQYGGFSGGLTTIETKTPPAEWQFALLDFVPGLRIKSGRIAGISSETPRVFLGGPLIKNKLTISEAFDYTIRNRTVRGLPWPSDQTKLRGFSSFTNLQAILSPKHLLSGSIAVFSQRTEFADINSLMPQSASSNLGSKGAFATATDTSQFGFGVLTTTFRYTRFKSNAYGQGDLSMSITPEGMGGNAFNSWNRTANQYEALPILQLVRKRWLGSHDMKLGADVVHRDYDGASSSRPVSILREDRTLAERINFLPASRLSGNDSEFSEFAQDHWALNDRLAVDLGLRVATQTLGRSVAAAPRFGLVYALDKSQKTVLRTGGGLFYDRVPLLASTFTSSPTRVVSQYDSAGLPLGPAVAYPNVYLITGGQGELVRSNHLDSSPRDVTWNLEVSREIRPDLNLRFSYLQSATSDLYIAAPWSLGAAGQPVLGLSHTGNSHYREFQAAAYYKVRKLGDFRAAYLRTKATGSLNTLASVFVPFEQPTIRPNVNGYLPADLPNRLLGSGIFHLPWNLTVSPVIDLHTGFRYSNIDVLQNYVGQPNSQRFPTYFSLDLKVYRDFHLPSFMGRLRDRHFRIGLYSLNATNHSNPHDVYNNVTSPVFGHLVGYYHRTNGFLIDLNK